MRLGSLAESDKVRSARLLSSSDGIVSRSAPSSPSFHPGPRQEVRGWGALACPLMPCPLFSPMCWHAELVCWVFLHRLGEVVDQMGLLCVANQRAWCLAYQASLFGVGCADSRRRGRGERAYEPEKVTLLLRRTRVSER